ncbi:hypothetical protein D8674_007099 [Pyrus ussuriensis x Pyrus communis]|uniref:Uncharacterized protein n=1 Tax=Pyrus ussuriensis x Pyrus communis TaxID=2448454 RepID=A0A5N5G1X7_9ROSA|nr:hypothetical protein D8674_007099 [Pyrus ussuriensis x Pyrus communis]
MATTMSRRNFSRKSKLQLLEFDDGSVPVVPVNPTSTAAKKRGRKMKINLLADAVAALCGGVQHRNGTGLVVGRHDHEASTSGHQCHSTSGYVHESLRAKKRKARAMSARRQYFRLCP